jgi:hypothetical protein
MGKSDLGVVSEREIRLAEAIVAILSLVLLTGLWATLWVH